MNILVISHVYPGGGTPQSFTPVVHYFAREWVKQGHKVIVVNLSTYFPSIVYHLPSFVKKYLVNKFQFALPEKRLNKAIDFNYEGVDVIRVPIFKYKPSMVVSYKRQTKQADYIIAKLQERGFVPDVAVGHWQNPLYILSRIKTHYGCGTAMVLHGSVSFDRYPNWRDLTSQIDLWGLRSVCMTEAFDKLMGAGAPRFICASGTPQSIVNPEADLMRWNDRYIYVGFLLDRKYPDVVIKTLPKVYGRDDYHLDVVYVFGHFEYYDSSVHNTTAKWTNRKIVAAGINYFPLPQICVKAEYNQRIFHSKYNNEPVVNIGIAYQGFFL